MELAVPMADFHFESASNSPYATAPSSPRLFGESFGYYTSAPSSPTRIAAIYNHFNNHQTTIYPSSPSSVVPLNWEEKPSLSNTNSDDDEAFEFGGQLDAGLFPITAADELFEEGKIRPLKPPPLARILRAPSKIRNEKNKASSPRSPKSDMNKSRAVEETTRGRERTNPLDGSRGSRRAARSLSPLRAGFDLAKSGGATTNATTTTTNSTITSTSNTNYAKGGSKKWRLRDLLLFRSASEGRATGDSSKDPLRKHTLLSPLSSSMLSKKGEDDSKNSSFRSTDSGSSRSSSRRGPASAHEKHYMANRAVSEEMKRKTFLPYRQGLLGCIGFNPAINGIAKGFGSIAHRRS